VLYHTSQVTVLYAKFFSLIQILTEWQLKTTTHRHRTRGQNSMQFISVCTSAPVFTEEKNVLYTAHLEMKYFRNMLTQTRVNESTTYSLLHPLQHQNYQTTYVTPYFSKHTVHIYIPNNVSPFPKFTICFC